MNARASFYELNRWRAFRTIKTDGKYSLRFRYASLIAFSLTLLSTSRLGDIHLTGINGLASMAIGSVPVLAGFYIAALAAVSTFSNIYIDHEIGSPRISVDLIYNGRIHDTILTRRMYLSYLFGYLSILSLLTILFCGFIGVFNQSYQILIGQIESDVIINLIHGFTKTLACGIIFNNICQMASCTLHGVFILMEKVHQPSE